MNQIIVIAICICIFLAIMGFDLFLYKDDEEDNSISQIIIKYSRHPFVPWFIGLFMGVLAGHWFA